MAKRLTEERIEKMAVEIRAFLLEHGIWQDTDIYFNGKRFTTRDPETKKYYYNDPEKLFVEDNQNPRDYFEYVADDHILSMSFEEPEREKVTTDELRAAYCKAAELKGPATGMTCLGVLFEPFHDITIWRDENGGFWYSSYYVGD